MKVFRYLFTFPSSSSLLKHTNFIANPTQQAHAERINHDGEAGRAGDSSNKESNAIADKTAPTIEIQLLTSHTIGSSSNIIVAMENQRLIPTQTNTKILLRISQLILLISARWIRLKCCAPGSNLTFPTARFCLLRRFHCFYLTLSKASRMDFCWRFRGGLATISRRIISRYGGQICIGRQ